MDWSRFRKMVAMLAVAGFFNLPAGAAERVALVVGCANYKADPNLVLDTPVQDAKDLGALLGSPALGFEVIPVLDATVEDFYAGLRKFKTHAQGARIALVFFSGHGIEHEGQNYLITVNASLETEDQLETQTMNLDHVMKDLGGTGATVKVAILDCCRNNPFARTKSWVKTKSAANDAVLRALGEAEIPQATLVCFATSAGRKAAAVLREGSKNSPFTELLIDEMAKPGQPLRTIFENVHDRIAEATAGRQVPTVKTDNALSEVFRKTVLVAARTVPVAPMVNRTPPPPPVVSVPQATPQAIPPMAKLTPASTPRFVPPPATPATSSTATSGSPSKATKETPFVNSLGMPFVPVPGTKVMFCVWDTRVEDYAAYAKEKGITPEKPDFEQGPMHPVVNVSWEDATAFCVWLSKKEGRTYRLPTDAEWSTAVGLGAETGSTPEAKGRKTTGFPWGSQWPPPQGAGNYDESLNVDSFSKTSPVGSFAPNRYGLYDMSGNVWQWCDDWYDAKKDYRVLRGGSWYVNTEFNLRSSYRLLGHPTGRSDYYGFRCVLVVSGG